MARTYPAGCRPAALPLALDSARGERRSLEEFRGRPVLLSFLGSANCMFCRAFVIRLVQARTRIEAAGASVVLVAYHDPELLMSMMLKDLNLPFVLLIDPTREAYRRWGLGYGSRRFLWSPILIAKALGLALRGIRVSGTAPDEFQFGADFVIDAAGCVALQHRLKSYHDRTPIDRLLQAAHGE